jgi:hypothetical protein
MICENTIDPSNIPALLSAIDDRKDADFSPAG